MCRFGPFEVDFANSRVLKSGIPIRVQEQPLLVLKALLENPGEIVTREQLRETLWASETFVDFERSLNAAVAKLRQALSDSAERPLYIETVARKGYRFIAPVTPTVTQTTATKPEGTSTEPVTPPRRQVVWPLILLGAAIVVGGTVLLFRRGSDPGTGDDAGSIRFTVTLPEGSRLAEPSFAPQMAISPDGRKIALAASVSSDPSIWWRPLASETLSAVNGTEGARLPFWSPDSEEVGFFANGELKIVKLPAGPVRTVCNAPAFFGGTWNSRDVVLFSNGTTLLRVGASGGPPTPVTQLNQPLREVHQTWPQFLPDQKHFLYFGESADGEKSGVFLASLDGSSPRMIFANKTRGAFAPPNHLLFVRDGTLFARALDRNNTRTEGRSIALANHVNEIYSYGQAAFSVSAGGVVLYRTVVSETTQLVLYSRNGKRVRTFGSPGPYTQVTISPDEKVAALNVKAPTERIEAARIWLLRLSGEVISRLDFGGIANTDPVWAPDSRRIAFALFDVQGQRTQILQWRMGDPSPTLLLDDGNSNKPDDWPSGGFLLCRRNDRIAFSLPAHERGHPRDLGDKAFFKDQLHVSPDGKMIAYNTWATGYYADKSTHPDVFAARFPGFSDTTQVSTDGGVQPVWGRGGRELYYLASDGSLMLVEMGRKGTMEVTAPKRLFRSSIEPGQWRSQYAASADGQRFYVLEPVTPERDTLHVITHWDRGEGK